MIYTYIYKRRPILSIVVILLIMTFILSVFSIEHIYGIMSERCAGFQSKWNPEVVLLMYLLPLSFMALASGIIALVLDAKYKSIRIICIAIVVMSISLYIYNLLRDIIIPCV